ncbi:TetR/AcrR family transcriptional regulator [Propionicicella superfundia]|uniref:TetR/AcrR family transcriptional regulator n=1 Tax=Propionicicella superfundia TaxID=348582 RepID=UPI0004282502|nr:TetR family transcriptional regulator [Propionicicella superfundia]
MEGTRSGPGRPARISRERVEQAVIAVGFDAATTTSVARHLGVEQSSLYRHIGSREQMVLGAVERVFAACDWDPPATDWQAYLRAVAATIWRVLRENRGLAATLYELEQVTESARAVMTRGVARLVGYGWQVPEAVLVLDSISDMTGDTVNQIELAERSTGPSREELAERYLASARATGAEHPSADDALAEQTGRFIIEMLHEDPQEWWRRKLDLLIAGAEHLRASQPPAGTVTDAYS